MPRNQVASVPNFEFGPSPANGDSLRWQAKRGCRLQGKIEAHDADLSCTFQVSYDGSTWTNTTVADHGAVLTNVTTRAGGSFDFSISLRQDRDKYLRMSSSGGRGILQLRGAEWLNELKL